MVTGRNWCSRTACGIAVTWAGVATVLQHTCSGSQLDHGMFITLSRFFLSLPPSCALPAIPPPNEFSWPRRPQPYQMNGLLY